MELNINVEISCCEVLPTLKTVYPSNAAWRGPLGSPISTGSLNSGVVLILDGLNSRVVLKWVSLYMYNSIHSDE